MAECVCSADYGAANEVLVYIPSAAKAQLVFRQIRDRAFGSPPTTEGVAISQVGAWEYRKYFWDFVATSGFKSAVKGWLKLLTTRRALFCATLDGALAHYTWTTLGRSRYYWIENEAAVIGPIWTAAEVRGRNVAAAVLQDAVNAHIARGTTIFYIDTSPANKPCLRVISKCGFYGPVGVFLRPDTL